MVFASPKRSKRDGNRADDDQTHSSRSKDGSPSESKGKSAYSSNKDLKKNDTDLPRSRLHSQVLEI